MRNVSALALIVLIPGCASHTTVVVPPIHVDVAVVSQGSAARESPFGTAIAKAVFGPETVVAQMALGCGYFYRSSGRWPHTKEEVAVGMSGANLSTSKLKFLEQLNLREDRGSLVIDFVSTENGRMQGTITLQPQSKDA